MSARVLKRIRKTNEEYNISVAAGSSISSLHGKSDSEIFVIDRRGSKSAKRKAEKELVPKARRQFTSSTEKLLIKRTGDKLKQRLTTQNVEVPTKVLAVSSDLWDNEVFGSSSKLASLEEGSSSSRHPSSRRIRATDKTGNRLPAKPKYLKVAVPGMSYNPSKQDHQQALAAALALQLKKERELEQAQGTSQSVSAASGESLFSPHGDASGCASACFEDGTEDGSVVSDSSNESGSKNENDGDDQQTARLNSDGSHSGRKSSQKQKLTRAQRNKIKNRRIVEAQKRQDQACRAMLSSIDDLPALVRSVEQDEQVCATERALRRAHREQLKAEQQQEAISAMTYVEAGSVPLSDELGASHIGPSSANPCSSLRRLVPKGAPVQQTLGAMQHSGAASKPDRRKRRAYEKPYGSKNLVWIPKYKY